MTTEPVLDHRHLQLHGDGRTHHLPFHLVRDSPIWAAAEHEAGIRVAWDAPVTFARSLYGVYGGLPGASAHVLTTAVDHGRRLAADWESPALVVSNLPPADLTQWRTVRTPDAEVTLAWAHRADIAGGLEGFTAQIPTSKRRTEFRRQHRRGTEAGLRLRTVTGSDLIAVLPTFTDQARATALRHGQALYGLDLLAPLVHVPGAVALLAETDRGDLAGGFLCFLHHDVLYLWTAAIDQHRKAELHTYGWLMAEGIRYATAHGATVIDAGRGNYRYKHRIGLAPIPLTCAVYLTRPALALARGLQALDERLHRHVQQIWSGH